MTYYAGIDVSLEQSSVCVVDGEGRVVREAKVASELAALIGWFASSGLRSRGWGWMPGRCRSGFKRR
jgi:transposase